MTARKIVEKCAKLKIIRSRFAELFTLLIMLGSFLDLVKVVDCDDEKLQRPFLFESDDIIRSRNRSNDRSFSDDRFIFITKRC